MSLTGESSSKEPSEVEFSIESSQEGFSKFHLNDRYRTLRKLKDTNQKYVALYNEYYELYQAITEEELDAEVYHSCLSESNLSFMIVLLYISNMFNIEKDEKCLYSPPFRRSERFRLILSNVKVSDEEVHLMVDFASRISGPHKTKSHLEAIKACIEYAKRWVGGDSNMVSKTSAISYSMLKDSVKEIVGSDFFKSLPPHPFKKDYVNMNYVEMTLESWLKSNSNRILDEIRVMSQKQKQKQKQNPRTLIKAYRLSSDVRRILWGILQKFQELHKQLHTCERLTINNIYIGASLEVDFSKVRMTRGGYMQDFKKLKKLIVKILEHVSTSSNDNSSYPHDVTHYLGLIDEAKEDNRDILYHHPFVWSSCDVIKNIYIFAAIYESSTEQAQVKMSQDMKRHVPDELRTEWRQSVHPDTPYYLSMTNWSYFRTVELHWEMFYIRDGFAHIHDYIEGHKQSFYTTENEIFTMFPLYLAHFVKIVCKCQALRCVLFTSYNEE